MEPRRNKHTNEIKSITSDTNLTNTEQQMKQRTKTNPTGDDATQTVLMD